MTPTQKTERLTSIAAELRLLALELKDLGEPSCANRLGAVVAEVKMARVEAKRDAEFGREA